MAFCWSAVATMVGSGVAVAAQLVGVVEAADFLDGGFGLVAVQEVEGDEGVGELGHGGAGADVVGAEAGEGGGADGEDAVELVGGVGAVVPEVGVGVGGAEGAGVLVGNEEEAGFFGVGEDFVEGFVLVGFRRKFTIAVVDGYLVPDADADRVGVGKVGDALRVEGDVGVRVVHDGDGLVDVGVGEGAGGEVVGKAEGVAGFVGGELADALEDHG